MTEVNTLDEGTKVEVTNHYRGEDGQEGIVKSEKIEVSYYVQLDDGEPLREFAAGSLREVGGKHEQRHNTNEDT